MSYRVKATVPHLETGYPNPSKPVTPGTNPAIDAMFMTLPPRPPCQKIKHSLQQHYSLFMLFT